MLKVHPLFAFLAIFCSSLTFVSLDAAAQTNLAVTHEIYSWDVDGRARAFVHINLPDQFYDVESATIARVECGDGTVCYHGLLSVVRTDDQEAIGTFSLQLRPGLNVLDINVTALDRQHGSITHAVEGLRIAVPRPRPLEVEFDGYQISGKNPDYTVNATLEFTIRKSDDWPMTQIHGSLRCEGIVACGYDEIIIPDWVKDESIKEHRWQTTINNLPAVPVRLNAIFDAQSENWSGSERTTALRTIAVAADDSPDSMFNWQVESTDVQGYYMDGTARVDLSLKADPIGPDSSDATRVASVCLFANETSSAHCQTVHNTEAGTVSKVGGRVVLSALRLPSGDNILLIDAGDASDHVVVSIGERIVMSRDMWECFNDRTRIEQFDNLTCSGFAEPYVRKWNADTVRIYREGDPSYIAILDHTLGYFHANLGVEYEIVDQAESADVHAYVGHDMDPQVNELLWEGCSEGFRCEHAESSIGDPRTVDRGALSLRHFGNFTPGDDSQVEFAVIYNVMDQLRHVLIPSERPARPYMLGPANRPDFIRPHDWAMYRLIYSSKARLGSPFENLRQFVVFADETLDYEPALIEPDLLAYKVARQMFGGDSISLNLNGAYIRGGTVDSGPRVRVQYADFGRFQSNRAKFSSDSWSSIIFGWDEESWSSAGGQWTMSAAHGGRGRNYRSNVNFDFILADPTRMLIQSTLTANRIDVVRQSDGLLRYTVKPHPESQRWPVPTFEIILDQETFRMISYTMVWEFEQQDGLRSAYRVEADVSNYGAEFEIPDEVREGSAYLADRE